MPLITAHSASGDFLPRPWSPGSELFVLISFLASVSAQRLPFPTPPAAARRDSGQRSEPRSGWVAGGQGAPHLPLPTLSEPPSRPTLLVPRSCEGALCPSVCGQARGPPEGLCPLGQEQRHPRCSLDLPVGCRSCEAHAGAYSLSIYQAPVYAAHLLRQCWRDGRIPDATPPYRTMRGELGPVNPSSSEGLCKGVPGSPRTHSNP